jgi:SAM-dependent methyltransferase
MDIVEELTLVRLPRHRAMLWSRVWMRFLRAVPHQVKRVVFGGSRHYCPICGHRLRRFMAFGHIPDEWCPMCISMSRHRMMWHVLHLRTDLFGEEPRKLLHLAPESALEDEFKQLAHVCYVTADLHDLRVQDRVDITAMPYGDHSFDAILCSHVLEHVPDDRSAMREFARVLKPGGWALIMVPFHDDAVTDEDPEAVDVAERERRFGQHDHVRYYGRDIVGRLEATGLRVQCIRAVDILSPGELTRQAVRADETAFLCSSDS